MNLPIRTRVALYVTLFFAVVIIVLSAVMVESYERYSYREFDVTLQAAASSVANRMVEGTVTHDRSEVREDVNETLSDFQRKIGIIRVLVMDNEGKEMFSFNDQDSVELRVQPDDFVERGRKRNFVNIHFHHRPYRAAMARFELGEDKQGSVVVVGSIGSTRESINRIQGIAFLLDPITILIVGLGSFLFARRALRPLERVTNEIDDIEAGRLPDKLKEPGTRDEIERLTKSFNSLIGRIRGLMQSQRNFLIDASHELKTPLTVIQTEIEMLLMKTNLSTDDRENLQQLLGEVEYASGLAVDLIFLSRLESTTQMDKTRISLDKFVQETVDHALPLATRKGIKVHLALESRCFIQADGEMLKRALFNVVENGIKYGKSGGKVKVTTKADSSFRKAVVIVGDNGEGIDESELERIFDRFYRTRRARSGDEKGSGLGLSIARQIIEQHGGRISIRSQLGAGTIVMIKLNVA